jgi:1-deoxy-D-xylulose-5-phosphate synthase
MSQMLLDSIRSPQDVKKLYNTNPKKLVALSKEIREVLVQTVSKNGGHLSPNLGVVELTLAIHIAFDIPKDSIVFDVGHQSYVHKLLTGRADSIGTLRTLGGLSGFPKRSESEYDFFNTGHSSTSVSAALGIARAKKLNSDESYSIALVGDGACSGGMIFEAINDAGHSELPLIIILNDNSMSISNTVGAIRTHLTKIRASRPYISFKRSTRNILSKTKFGKYCAVRLENLKNKLKYFLLPNVYFESLGLSYIGPVDGHDIPDLLNAFNIAKKLKRPVVVHVVTQKGRGYKPAEDNPEMFHGIGAFDADNPYCANKLSNSQVFGDALLELAKSDDKIIAITAAMPLSTGLTPFEHAFPERFFDVGIAEQHAITMAAGASVGGLKPVAVIYSTFLQRAYDQLLHDVCLQNLPVVIGVDRAGLVGEDGETHQGVYDISYLLAMPNMCLFSPASISELKEMLKLALNINKPVAIRYNRGLLPDFELKTPVELGVWEEIKPIQEVNIIASGRLVETALKASSELNVGVINARFLCPMDYEMLKRLKQESKAIITLEDGLAEGGFGSRVAKFMCRDISVYNLGVPNRIIPHAKVEQQDALCGIDTASVRRKILNVLGE